MPKSVTIRNVPDHTVNELSARAAQQGQSLQEYLKAHLVRITSKPDINTWLAEVKADMSRFPPVHISAEEILAARDADRR